MNRPPLLHNMSVAPRTVIEHHAPPRAGRAVAFQLPSRSTGRPALILRALDGRRWRGTAAAAEVELRRRLDRCAAGLPFPPAVLTGKPGDAGDPAPDLLTICTVLAKSSDCVYLRDKEPNLSRIAPGRLVVLHLPVINTEKP